MDGGVTPDQVRSEAALHDAVHGLFERDPLASAAVPFVPWQKWTGLAALAVVSSPWSWPPHRRSSS